MATSIIKTDEIRRLNDQVLMSDGALTSNVDMSNVVFPPIGLLSFWHGYKGSSSSVTFTLDGTSSYTVIFNGRHSSSPYYPKNLTFVIDSSDGTISHKTDAWDIVINESFNNTTKVLTLSVDSTTEIMSILIFLGAISMGI